jgi:hypothetical protein
MLVVDPLKRITIPEIRKSPWFEKDLPSYLQEPDLHQDRLFFSKLNQEIVDSICKVFCLLIRK